MLEGYKFNRMELAGALGDLGALLPIAIAMVLINGLNPIGLFFSIAMYYIASGVFFGVTVPVQPMKVIGAYAIATAMEPKQLLASSLLMGGLLLLVGLTGAIEFIRRCTPQSVIRGVQLSTGALLISSGMKFVLGTSSFQKMHSAVEPYLSFQSIASVPAGIVLGVFAAVVTLLLLENRRFPAALVVIVTGIVLGVLFNNNLNIDANTLGFHLPKLFPFPFPDKIDFSFALFALVIPQLPMTMGNAVLAYSDLSKEYFGDKASRITNRNVCISMAFANFFSFCFGGMPMCHGAGGLAAHYRFGARTAGSNLMIGAIFCVLTLLFGKDIVGILNLLPLSFLGVLLVFAGAQLTLTIMDLQGRKEFFVATVILGITLASNLAVGFVVGIILAQLLRWDKLAV